MTYRPTVMLVLEGWGICQRLDGNALAIARTDHLDRLRATFAWTQLQTHGPALGADPDRCGNSELGFLAIASGTPPVTAESVVNEAITSGRLARNKVLHRALTDLTARGGRLHLLGPLSDSGDQAREHHYVALLDVAAGAGLGADKVVFHGIADGHEGTGRQASRQLARAMAHMMRAGVGTVGSVCGRCHALCDTIGWSGAETMVKLLTVGEGRFATSPVVAAEPAYARGETDIDLSPTIVLGDRGLPRPHVTPDDLVIYFGLRVTSVRPLLDALDKAGNGRIRILALTDAEDSICPPPQVSPLFALTLRDAGIAQHWIADKLSAPRVERFLSGRRFSAEVGAEFFVIESAADLTETVIADCVIQSLKEQVPFIFAAFGTADVYGHRGDVAHAVIGAERVDNAMGRIAAAVEAAGGCLIITSDHGNAEEMVHAESGLPLVAHTTNPVPFWWVEETARGTPLRSGSLIDVAPTLLALLDLPVPEGMTGRDLRDAVTEPAPAMPAPHEDALTVLEAALAEEMGSCRYYLHAAAGVRSEASRQLCQQLAKDEERHIMMLQDRYCELGGDMAHLAALRAEDDSRGSNPEMTVLEILAAAADAERSTANFYAEKAATAADELVRNILTDLAAEEGEHVKRLLLSYREAERQEKFYNPPDRIH